MMSEEVTDNIRRLIQSISAGNNQVKIVADLLDSVHKAEIDKIRGLKNLEHANEVGKLNTKILSMQNQLNEMSRDAKSAKDRSRECERFFKKIASAIEDNRSVGELMVVVHAFQTRQGE